VTNVSLSSLAGSGLDLSRDASLKPLLSVDGVGQFTYDTDGRIYKPDGRLLENYTGSFDARGKLDIRNVGGQRLREGAFVSLMQNTHRSEQKASKAAEAKARADERARVRREKSEAERVRAEAAAALARAHDEATLDLSSVNEMIRRFTLTENKSLRTNVLLAFWQDLKGELESRRKLVKAVVYANESAIKTSVSHLESLQRSAREALSKAKSSIDVYQVIEEYSRESRNVLLLNSSGFCSYGTADCNAVAEGHIKELVERQNKEFMASLQRRAEEFERAEGRVQRKAEFLEQAKRKGKITFATAAVGFLGLLGLDQYGQQIVKGSNMQVLAAEDVVNAGLAGSRLKVYGQEYEKLLARWAKFNEYKFATFGTNAIPRPHFYSFNFYRGEGIEVYATSVIDQLMGNKRPKVGQGLVQIPGGVMVQAYQVLCEASLNLNNSCSLAFNNSSGELNLLLKVPGGPKLVSGIIAAPAAGGIASNIYLQADTALMSHFTIIDSPEELAKFSGLIEAVRVLKNPSVDAAKLRKFVLESKRQGVDGPFATLLEASADFAEGKYTAAEEKYSSVVKLFPKHAYFVYKDLMTLSSALGNLKPEYLSGFLESMPAKYKSDFSQRSPLYYAMYEVAHSAYSEESKHKLANAVIDFISKNKLNFIKSEDKALFFRSLAACDIKLGTKIGHSSAELYAYDKSNIRADSADLIEARAMAMYANGDWFKAAELIKALGPSAPAELREAISASVMYIRPEIFLKGLPQPVLPY